MHISTGLSLKLLHMWQTLNMTPKVGYRLLFVKLTLAYSKGQGHKNQFPSNGKSYVRFQLEYFILKYLKNHSQAFCHDIYQIVP